MSRKAKETVEVSEVLQRFDPEGDVESDGDPTFEARLDEEQMSPDKYSVCVHKDDMGKYKGRRYEVMYGRDAKLLCGQQFQDDEPMTFREHTYMWVDREYHERRLRAERKANFERRAKMIKRSQSTVFVNQPGMGPSR